MEGNDYIEAGDGDDFVDAGAGDDELLGNPGDDILWGGLGIDELLGLAGNDSLDGGAGADSVDGGLDRNYCVKDPKDKKELSCFYDTKAPALKSISVSASTRSIDTSVTAQWVRVKALITEAGSGLTDVGFFFSKGFASSPFGASGSLKYPDRQPTTCEALTSLSQTPPPNTTNPKSHWCIEQQSSSAVVVEFLIAAPYRLAKGTYKLTSMILSDGALNRSSQNGLWFNATVNQTSSVPSGIPVLKSFEFISENKVNTAEADAKIMAEVSISTGPVGLSWTQIKFQRDVDRRTGENSVDLVYDSGRSPGACDLKKYAKPDQKNTCVLSEEGGIVKLLLISNLQKNSPAGTYRFSFLGLSSKTSKGSELGPEDLKKDSRYEKFTKLAIVQSAASKPFVTDGAIDLISITADTTEIDTGSGPASFTARVSITRNPTATNWTLNGSLTAMHCRSGSVRKFSNYRSPLEYGITIQAGEYCSELRDEGTGKKWWPVISGSTIASGDFRILPGSTSATVNLTIPANYRKGMIIVGLGYMSSNIGAKNESSRVGNWSSMQNSYNTNRYPGTLNCGKYPSCTQHYAVLQNGE
jgi:hypothetical protein